MLAIMKPPVLSLLSCTRKSWEIWICCAESWKSVLYVYKAKYIGTSKSLCVDRQVQRHTMKKQRGFFPMESTVFSILQFVEASGHIYWLLRELCFKNIVSVS